VIPGIPGREGAVEDILTGHRRKLRRRHHMGKERSAAKPRRSALRKYPKNCFAGSAVAGGSPTARR